jgi:two-component system KDP operon response regulator KdpE
VNASPKILIVEDEAHMRRFLRTTLTHNGYETAEAVDGVQALTMSLAPDVSLVLLDLGLPDVDGVDVVGQIREQRDVPIIIISARHYEFAKIEALDCGANDYVTKPFGAGELLARIRVALRTRGAPTTAAPQSVVVIGDLHIDLGNPIVSLGGQEVSLTPTEHKLLGVLARRIGRVVSHRELLQEVWGPDSAEQVEYLRVFMRQLRYKLEPEPTQPRYLLTVSGVGYRLKGEG